jgi:membrane protease YdiL (CAAX protease family)
MSTNPEEPVTYPELAPRGEALPLPPGREAFVLGYAAVALALTYFHGTPVDVDPRFRLLVWFATSILVLFVVPALVLRFVWREPLAGFGFCLGRPRVWGKDLVLLLAVMLPVVLVMSRTADFHAYYPRFELARHSLGWWAVGALGWLLYFMAWEWFFRGFMLFNLAPRMGPGLAIMVQMVPFAMAHFPKLEAEAWSSMIAGIALGVMAWRGRSFVGPWLLHWSVATCMDLSVILWPLKHG